MMSNKEWFNPASWEKAWREDAHTAVNRMKRAGMDPAHVMDQRAKAFNEQAFSDEGRHRAKRIMSWLEHQGVVFKDASILDIGAASGGFTVPFAKEGAKVTAVETSLPLIELMKKNISSLTSGAVEIVAEPFEQIDLQAKGWEKAYDLVFVSMCPVLVDWESVERVLSVARKYCYMSLSVGPHENSLIDEVWPLVSDQPRGSEHLEMAYLINLLLLKGYAYQSLITREITTKTVSRAKALDEAMTKLSLFGVSCDERVRNIVSDYLEKAYPSDEVSIRQGGRFGKVLVQLERQHMYSSDEQI